MHRTALPAAVLLIALGCDPKNGPSGPTPSDAGTDAGSVTSNGVRCAAGYTCYGEPGSDLVWVMKNDGKVNGPTCQGVCAEALMHNCAYHACDDGRTVEYTTIAGFSSIASGLGFACREGGCWSSVSPGEGLYLVSIATDAADGSTPSEKVSRCRNWMLVALTSSEIDRSRRIFGRSA
jgi:hypothetical protein